MEQIRKERAYVVDVGSASVRLIVGESCGNGDVSIIFNQGRVTKLREALNHPDSLMGEMAQRTLVGLRCLIELAVEVLPTKGVCLCTQAVRQADQDARTWFLAQLAEITGIDPVILSPEQEGNLAWEGSSSIVAEDSVLIDLGGGSTEFIWKNSEGAIVVRSVPVAAATGDVHSFRSVLSLWERLLKEQEIPEFRQAVLLGGTASSYAGMHCRAEIWKPGRLHGMFVPPIFFRKQAEALFKMPINIRKKVLGLESGREIIAINGGFHLAAIIQTMGLEIIRISEQGIRFGQLKALLC